MLCVNHARLMMYPRSWVRRHGAIDTRADGADLRGKHRPGSGVEVLLDLGMIKASGWYTSTGGQMLRADAQGRCTGLMHNRGWPIGSNTRVSGRTP
jgi:hypothetical protein